MGRAGWLRGFLILLLVLATPLAIYWFGYAEVRVAQKQRQFYLTLAATGKEVRDRLMEHDSIAVHAGGAEKTHEQLREGVGYLRSRFGDCSNVKAAVDETRLRLGSDARGGLELRTAHSCDEPHVEGERGAFLIPLEDLIPWELVESDFEGLIVLDPKEGKSRLVAQDRRLPAQSLGQSIVLYRGDDVISLDDVIQGAQKKVKKEGEGSNRNVWENLVRKEDVWVRIAGTDYLAFVLPVRTPVGRIGEGEGTVSRDQLELVLCGLVQKEKLRRDAVALSPVSLARFATGIAILFLTIPFLKLRFIGRHERMRPFDVWLLGSSLLVATALGLLAVLHEFTLVQLRGRFDERLVEFAAEVRDRVKAESAAALLQLQASAPALLASEDGTMRGSILSSGTKFDYPSFEVLFSADATGRQRTKWAPGTIPTPMISIVNQGYFLRTLWSEPPPPSANLPDLHSHSQFEAIVAPTSGLEVGVFAMHAPDGANDAIVGLGTPFLSLHGPVKPQPFQFVVLDERGGVTFRAALGPIRNQRFLSDEVEGGRALLAAAQQTTRGDSDPREFPRPADYRYRGSVYRMTALRLPDPVGGTLVVFYEKSAYESLALQIFATSLLFGIGTVGAILLGAATAYLMFGRDALEWAWPSARREPLYVLGTGVGIAIALAMILMRGVAPGAFPGMLWLVPGLAMIVPGLPRVRRWIRACEGCKADSFWPAWQSWHFVVFEVVAISVLVGVPIGLVFEDVFRVYSTAYEKTISGVQSHDFAIALSRAGENWVKSGSAELPPTDCLRQAGPLRCRIPGRIYASPENHAGLERDRKRYADYRSVDSSDGSQEKESVFTAGFAHFLADRSDRGAALAPALAEISRDHEAAAALGFGWSPHTLEVLGAAAVLLGLFLVIRSVSRHVLGLGIYRDGVLDGAHLPLTPRSEAELSTEAPRKWLLLRPPERAVESVKDAQRFDLRDPKYVADKFTITVKPAQVAMLDHLEARIADRKWRDSLLSILELQPPTSDLVLVSEIDPFHFLAQRLRESTAAAARRASTTAHDDAAGQAALKEMEQKVLDDEAELAAWATAMRSVEKIRYAMPEDRSGQDGAIRARLETECGWSAPMIRIHASLLQHEHLLDYRWSEVVQFVLDAAAPYYRSLWNLCSQQEKLVLIHLAHSGLVNPKNVEVVRRLAHRRLVRVDPSFQLICESFREFVRTAEPPERVSAWEQTHPSEAWSRIGVPLYALAAILVAILFATQQTLVTTLISVATGSVGSITAIRNLIASARSLTGEKVA